MKIYKVDTYSEVTDEHTGYAWVSNKKEAMEIATENSKRRYGTKPEELVRRLEIGQSKKSILVFLNAHASYPDNG